MKNEIIKGKRLEWLSILFFATLYLAIAAFHEPWFDEAQSWQIAKCETISRLIFYIPHYEGNPPLWYLILAVPAKLGVPFEWGLKAVGFVISLCSVLLLEFRSPFPRHLKVFLPFTYFFFYQYGIIVRPYALAVLAFVLTAMAFKSRNAKPWMFVLCLGFLCETSSFCVAISAGIAASWLFEILREDRSLRKLIRDARTHSLLVLLIFALILTSTILPPKDALFTDYLMGKNSILTRLFIAVSTALSETLLITSPWFKYETTTLAAGNIVIGPLVVGIFIQIIIFIHILSFSNKRNVYYFFVPYVCFCLFGAAIVLAGHYLGMGFCVFIFWLWISCDDDRQFEIGRHISEKLRLSDKDRMFLKKFAIAFCTLSLGISLFWSIRSAGKEVVYQYSYGRETARFLEETGLIHAKIAEGWYVEDDEQPDSSARAADEGAVDYASMDLKSNGWPVALCAYAGKNIVYNFNDGRDDAAYVQFIRQTAEQNENTIERWKNEGIPDVLLGEVDVELLTDHAVTIEDYSPVYCMETNYIWKGNVYGGKQNLFVRNDLLDKYALIPLDRPVGMIGNTKFRLTDEMRERYENGEDINDILKPYLDYIFGEESGK